MSLNEAQKKAVSHREGPLLIVAGAGAGKTRVITHRISELVRNGVSPENILAITFTNKAAQEMKNRVSSLLKERPSSSFGDALNMPFISTFHALGVHILRRESERLPVTKNFTILDEGDSVSLIKEAMDILSLDKKQFDPKRMKNVISRNKGDLINQEEYGANAGNDYFPKILASVWFEYEKLLRKRNALDFDDLLIKTVFLFKNHKDVLKKYSDRWQYVHIDEYQDTNVAQYEMSKLLSQAHKNICVVGDMDQSIYSWRGADFKNILNFEKDFPEATVVLLEENYRSSANILNVANDIIKKNKIRKEKNLFTQQGEGEKLSLFEAYDEADEATFVARKVRMLLRKGVEPQDIAVLYRANFQSRVLEEMFLEENIPYQVLGVKFFDRREIKDVLAYIRAGLNPDNLADIKRIVATPPRGIGKTTLAKMFSGQEDTLTPAMRKKVDEFRNILKDIGETAQNKKTSEAVKYAVTRSGIEDMLKKGSADDQERLENVRELVTLSKKYDVLSPEEGMHTLLEDAALASDQDSLSLGEKKEKNAVKLMTVHASKGLEFPYVFITGLEQDLFPHGGMGDSKSSEEREEEERRLFYVALTRAEKKLFLSYASVRTIFGSKQVNLPSDFLLDIDEELMEKDEVLEDIIEIE